MRQRFLETLIIVIGIVSLFILQYKGDIKEIIINSIIFVCGSIFFFLLIYFIFKPQPNPQPGEIWVLKNKNPYQPKIKYIIYGRQEDYVEYKIISSDYVVSKKVSFFKKCYLEKGGSYDTYIKNRF